MIQMGLSVQVLYFMHVIHCLVHFISRKQYCIVLNRPIYLCYRSTLLHIKMSTSKILIVVHFGKNFKSDMSSPIYNGGHKKLLYLDMSITHSSILDEVLHVTKWLARGRAPSILYLISLKWSTSQIG